MARVKLYELEAPHQLSADRFEMAAALTEIYSICRTASKVGKRVVLEYTSVEHQNPAARIKRTSGVPTLTVYAQDWEDE